MDLELNDKLSKSLLGTLKEYLPQCKESLVRNKHMNDLTSDEAATWDEAEWILTLDLLLGHLVAKFQVTYEGPDRLGDVVDALCACAREFVKNRPDTAPNHKLVNAVIVDFLNFWAGKRCMDLGLYTKDLYK